MGIEKSARLYIICGFHMLIYSVCIFHYVNKRNEYIQHLCFIFLILINSLSFTNISLTNPGYICKKFKNRNKEEHVEYVNGTKMHKFFYNDIWLLSITIDGVEYFCNYCEECNCFKMPGTSHCRECDCCVIEMDHHCFWFNTCIARNNEKYFYIYIFSITALSYFGGSSIHCISSCMPLSDGFIFGFCRFFFIFLICVLKAMYTVLGIFSLYYIYLALTNIRSRDFIKNIRRIRGINLKEFLMRTFGEVKKISCEGAH
jgi:palmitoyltransferase ZDHHC9/14/18